MPEDKTGSSLLGAVIGSVVSPAPEAEEEPAPAESVAAPGDESIDAVCSTTVNMRITSLGDVAKAALYLAMSDDISEERRIKETLLNCGWRSVATEVGGISGDLSMKVSRALVGAALNSGVVRKSTSEMHALLHAAQEAFSSFIPFGLLETSIGAKIAIVRNSQWIAVAHHERMGVGVMHV